MFRFLNILFSKMVVLAYTPHQLGMRVPFSPQSSQHLLLIVFLMIAILTGVGWNLSVVFKNFLYSHVHTMIGSLLLPSPHPLLSPPPPPFVPHPFASGRNCFALISVLQKREYKH
jgi:hypothetical protein